MAIASGVQTILGVKKETTAGTIAGASGAQLLRRTTASLDVVKETYESQEKVSHFQVSDFRHGVRRVQGTLDGELSPASYAPLMAAVLRKDFASGATTGAITTVAAAAGPPGTFTRSSGSFLTDGFKVGDIVRWTGWSTTATDNNSRNYRITALTATVMTVGTAATGASGQPEEVDAKTAGDSVTCTVVGKKSFIPTSSHTSDAYTIEKWFPDIAQSERYVGCQFGSMRLSLPATGLATVSFGVLGRSLETGTSAYFTSPTAATTTGITAAVNGRIRAGGADVATVTGAEITLDLGLSSSAVVGSNTVPGISYGRSRVSGQITAFFENATLRDAYLNETEVGIQILLTTSSGIAADFLAINVNRVKFGGASKSDPDTEIVQTLPFTALLDTAGGAAAATDQSTLVIQDSAA